MKRIAIGIANLDGKKPAVHLHRRAGANFSWIPWILKFIENWYSNIYKLAGNANSQFAAKIAIAPGGSAGIRRAASRA